MRAIVADLNRTLLGWFGYFKRAKASELGGIDGWIRMRLRSILRKRRGLEGRGRGQFRRVREVSVSLQSFSSTSAFPAGHLRDR